MDLWKQMSSSKCSFTCTCGIVLPLNPSTTTVYAWSAFYPSLRFTLSLQSAFTHSLQFSPASQSAVCSLQSAVHSPQSAVFPLHWLKSKKLITCLARAYLYHDSDPYTKSPLKELQITPYLRSSKIMALLLLLYAGSFFVLLSFFELFIWARGLCFHPCPRLSGSPTCERMRWARKFRTYFALL